MVDFPSKPVEPPGLGVAILGVPFDSVTLTEAAEQVERMIQSRRAHYVVTANVDFLTQARTDIELRRILLHADLVLCDGTPLIWTSRLLGNPLPERVAGADLVPHLIKLAAERGHRLFFLGATPESASRAAVRLKEMFPGLVAEFLAPPFKPILEMDNEEITRRIKEADPDILFVAFGCPKQEKWMAMHYRKLGVPVTIGVGATVDFLAGQVKRAPRWMQRSGVEWLFRLAQEPGRLFSRYARDLWVFGVALVEQLRHVARIPRVRFGIREETSGTDHLPLADGERSPFDAELQLQRIPLPPNFDYQYLQSVPGLMQRVLECGLPCVLDFRQVRHIDSTGLAWLLQLEKRTRARAQHLVLVAIPAKIELMLAAMRVDPFLVSVPDTETAVFLIKAASRPTQARPVSLKESPRQKSVSWHGEITVENSADVWESTRKSLLAVDAPLWQIDCSDLHFIDSSGMAVMLQVRDLARQNQRNCVFTDVPPAVRNVLEFGRCTNLLRGGSAPTPAQTRAIPANAAPVA